MQTDRTKFFTSREVSLGNIVRLFFAPIAGVLITFGLAILAHNFPLPLMTTALTGDEALQQHNHVVECLDLQNIMSTPDVYDTVTCKMTRGFGFTDLVFTYDKHAQTTKGGTLQVVRTGTGHAAEFGLPFHCAIELPGRGPNAIVEGMSAYTISTLREVPFLVNVIFWTVPAYFLFGLPRQVRAMYRRRRGCCRACGYPRGASPVCSECGRAVP